MDLKQFQHFTVIVDAGSLTKAAARLGVAQPALSQQVRALEKEFGADLLVRSTIGVRTTPAGDILYRHARAVLRQVDQARHEIDMPGDALAGSVAIGLPGAISSLVSLPLLQELRSRHPNVHLHLFQSTGGHLEELLASGRLDLCILFRDADFPGVVLEPLFMEELYVVGPAAALAGDDGHLDLAILAAQPLVLPSRENALRRLLERAFADSALELETVADVDSVPVLFGMALSEVASTVLPGSALPTDCATHPPLARLRPVLERPVSLCWASQLPRSSAAFAVAQLLRSMVGDLVERRVWRGVRARM